MALVGALTCTWVCDVHAIRPSKSYVSARAYAHYLESARAWMNDEWDKAVELIRVVLVYDPGNYYARARWVQIRWGHQGQLSAKTLRRYIRRAPRHAALYRILALEYWRRGKGLRADRAFRQALKRSSTLGPGERKTLVRDFALFSLSEGRVDEALQQIRIHNDAGQDLEKLRLLILSHQAKPKAESCSSPFDREHTCDLNDDLDVKLVNEGRSMSWSDSINWGFEVLKLQAACGAQTDPQICQSFESALRRLALPLKALQTKELF